MIIPITKTNDPKKKSVLLFVHGFMGTEKSWLGKNDEVRLPTHLKNNNYINENYDFVIFSYFTELFEVFNQSNYYISLFRRNLKSIFNIPYKNELEFKKNLSIEKIAGILKTDIKTKLRDYDRIVIIAHSMGGLVAKSCIINSIEEGINENIASYISIAVPHNGSNLANIGKLILNNPQIKDLQPLEDFIHKINNKWLMSKKLPLTAYFQCCNDNIVGDTSSIGYDIRGIKPEELDHDHFGVLKPDKDDTVVDLLIETIKRFEKEDTREYYLKDSYYSHINNFFGSNNDGEAALKSYVTTHENKAFRNEKFAELKSKAKCSITIMGVGITNVNAKEITSYLNSGISLRLLMMNPNILLDHFNFENFTKSQNESFDYLSAFDMMLKNNHLGRFYDRSQYNLEIVASYNRLKELVETVKEDHLKDSKKGNIEMRVFNSFIPMSLTSINSFEPYNKERLGKEEFIVEFSLPYSDKRIHIPISKESDIKTYNSFIESIDKLWLNSKPVDEVIIKDLKRVKK